MSQISTAKTRSYTRDMKKQRMKITSFLQISPVGIGSAYLHFKTSGYAAAFVMQINGPNFYRTYLQEEITIVPGFHVFEL